AGIVRFFPGNCQEKHFHLSEEQLLYVIQGEGIQIIDGKKVNIEKLFFTYLFCLDSLSSQLFCIYTLLVHDFILISCLYC
ncbi:hypothetical protein KWU95_17890, partial [Clostridioides difficile]|nr:hypothetical protein [Clostridioides difficile]